MGDLLSIVEIALFIILPLIYFYQRSNWSYQKYIPVLILLYLVWYATYALLHELGHYTGALLLNVEVIDYQCPGVYNCNSAIYPGSAISPGWISHLPKNSFSESLYYGSDAAVFCIESPLRYC